VLKKVGRLLMREPVCVLGTRGRRVSNAMS
jgi:hypothetical protein